MNYIWTIFLCGVQEQQGKYHAQNGDIRFKTPKISFKCLYMYMYMMTNPSNLKCTYNIPNIILIIPSEAGSLGRHISFTKDFHDLRSSKEKPKSSSNVVCLFSSFFAFILIKGKASLQDHLYFKVITICTTTKQQALKSLNRSPT